MTSDQALVGMLGKVGAVFFSGFDSLRESQRQSIEPVLSGASVLLACPTASGKTEAMFAPLVKRVMDLPAPVSEGPRIVAIAPTRALVNDLYSRLAPKLESLRLTCGRQTSDHRVSGAAPFLLITTPESTDSMLARRTLFDQSGQVSGHYLASVSAIFVDEAHLFDNSARGDQLLWLIARLRRIKDAAFRRDGADRSLQICGASATVSSPDHLASRLLGPEAKALLVPGGREIQVFSGDSGGDWLELVQGMSGAALALHLPVLQHGAGVGGMAEVIRSVLAYGKRGSIRKLLVFVPSRALCDALSAFLGRNLTNLRDVSVFGHHGSLDRAVREEAEREFGSCNDVVLVATSTLEVGVDIGDVDAVVLIGAPPDTNALLQRIGRSGRRAGVTRVVPIARSTSEACILASMLVAARAGSLDHAAYAPRWSVLVQQMASFVRQNGSAGRRRRDIQEFAGSVFGDEGRQVATKVADALVEEGCLAVLPNSERLIIGEVWVDRWGEGAMGMHGNLDSGAQGRPVVDSMTGEIIAHIPANADVPAEMSIAGSSWRVVQVAGELVLEKRPHSRGTAIRYSATAAPMRRAYCRHLALGLGLGETDTVQLDFGGKQYWFHFGGGAYELVLIALLPHLGSVRGLKGFALSGVQRAESLSALAQNSDKIIGAVLDLEPVIASLFSPGPFHKLLPDSVRKQTTLSLFAPEKFAQWLASCRILVPEQNSIVATVLKEMLADAIDD